MNSTNWEKNPSTGEPTFEEYMRRLNANWVFDSCRGTDKEVTADAEDFSGCWSESEDVVNNPTHYNYGKVECIEAIEESMTPEAFKGYLKGNALKYLWRYERKGNALQDAKKAQWYISRLISTYDE